MESMQYAEGLVKEFLLFRGFTHTFKAFDAELEADVSHGFQVDRILDLLFMVYVPRFEAENMVKLLKFLEQSLLASADARYHSSFRKLDVAVKKHYIVNAVQKGQPDKILSFFENYGDSLLKAEHGDDWHSWFALPYMKRPGADPRFQVYFSKEWLDTLLVSFRNFLSEIFDTIPIHLPVLLKLHNERVKSRALKQELENLRADNKKLQIYVKSKDDEIFKLRSVQSIKEAPLDAGKMFENETSVASDKPLSVSTTAEEFSEAILPKGSPQVEGDMERIFAAGADRTTSDLIVDIYSVSPTSTSQTSDFIGDTRRSWSREEDIPQVAVESQETFSGHTSAITRCRFSTSGSNVASASVDGTVRIWTPDAGASTSRNATIYCRAEILALEWENKSDRLLLVGTAGGGLKAWNVEAKRVVCDVNTDAAFPRILELKCSPTEYLFLSVAATHPRSSLQGVDAVGFGSLTVWNMRTWKFMNVLPLGEDPPVVTSVSFNHNGKLVAAGATDGIIRLFDMNGCLPITGWPAHDGCAVSNVKFSADHSSIFSLGGDGKVLEWSLHNQGQVLQSRDASIFCSIHGSKLPRHEMALDCNGKNLLLSSNLHSAPLFQLDGSAKAYRTLNHSGSITSVDWHPLLPMYLTGSSDHSIRVTSIA